MNESSPESTTGGADYVNMDGGDVEFVSPTETGAMNGGVRRRRRSSVIFRQSIRQSMRRLSSRMRRQSTTSTRPPTAVAAGDDVVQPVPAPKCGKCTKALMYLYSLALLIFSVTLVMGVIFTKQTGATSEEEGGMGLPPVLVFFLFWLLISWLAVMEGGQGALVGLQPIEKDLYAVSHPTSLKTTSLAYKGENMERFIVGRQFLVVLVVFGINTLGSAVADASLWNVHDTVTDIFLGSGLALILITLILGQLVAQVNAAECMLDFINTRAMLVTTYLALGIEALGLLHCTYLVQRFFASKDKTTPTSDDDDEPPPSTIQKVFFWLRVIISLALLVLAFVVTLSALFNGQTTMWEGVPNVVSVLLFFALMAFVGLMEGMQIALFAVINLPEDQLQQQNAAAHRNCRAIFSGENMQVFLIGRQICVTVCTFVLARITTINVDIDYESEETTFGLPSAPLQAFFNTGLLGAFLTTIVASLMWRIVASTFPVTFLSNPLISVIIRLCLILEMSGICSAAWVLARFVKAILKYEPDEVYLDEAEPTDGGAEPITERDEDIDAIFLRSSIVSLQATAAQIT